MTAILLTLIMLPDTTLFHETFDDPDRNIDLENTWLLEGTGRAWVEDERMHIQEDSSGIGVVVWLREEWPEDVKLSFNVEFSNNRGIGVLFVAASSLDSARTGVYDEYTQGQLNSYGFSFHRYFPDGGNNPGANIRKNSGFHLLSQAKPDPMLEAGRSYAVEISKTGAHLVMQVDGEVIHDVIDGGEFGAPHGAGRIGFRLRADPSCIMTLDDVIIVG